MPLVEGFFFKNHYKHLWMLQLTIFCHKVLDFFFQFLHVSFVIKLYPVRFGNPHSKLSLSLNKAVVDGISSLEVVSTISSASFWLLVANYPFPRDELDWLLDFESPQNIFVNVDDLIFLENHRLGQDCLIAHFDRS